MARLRINHDFCFGICGAQRLSHGLHALQRNPRVFATVQAQNGRIEIDRDIHRMLG
ncbi:hypothetical protein D3C78_1731040 [compost metagenome]